jgi:hypothetical protein
MNPSSNRRPTQRCGAIKTPLSAWLKLLLIGASAVLVSGFLWMETGPYVWFADFFAGNSGGRYSATLVQVCVGMLVVFPAIILIQSDPVLRNPRWKAWVMPRLLGVLAVIALGMAGLGTYHVCNPNPPREAGGVREAFETAGFFPTDVIVEVPSEALDWDRRFSIERQRKRGSEFDHFIPLDPSVWPNAALPVLLQVDDEFVPPQGASMLEREFSVVRKPLPLLARNAGYVPESARFCVILSSMQHEWAFWFGKTIMAGLALVVIGIFWLRGRKEWKEAAASR